MKSLVKKYNNIFAIIAIFLVAGGLSYIDNREGEGEFQTVVIEPGDTISEIATSYGADVDEFVTWVENHNDIEADEISPGQVIVIPVEVDENLAVASN